MKFTMNGKRLKNIINLCLLKGKYNQGLTNTKGQLGNCVKITTRDGRVLVENADASTYIRAYNRINEQSENGRIYVNAETLSKYLTDGESTLMLNDSNLLINNNTSVAEIPILESHEYAHVISRFTDAMGDDYETADTYSITEKLTLTTRVDVFKEEFIDAVSMAEKVGSCVYTFTAKKDTNDFSVSSVKLRESITTNITSGVTISKDAIASYSLPISSALKFSQDDEVIIFYDDEMPVVFRTSDMVIMRAPRTGE